MRRKPDQSAQKPDSATTAATATIADAAVKVGRLVPGSAVGALLVDFDGSAGGPRAARSIVMLDDKTLHQAIAVRQPVVLLFENGDPGLPIVVGLVPAAPGAELLAPLLVAPAAAVPASVVRPAPAPAERIEAVVDGKRVVLEGRDEVVLRCGEASITLRRDGKLILRGAYVETHAKGVNRIKGGSVKIN